jgi:hypothetical protein
MASLAPPAEAAQAAEALSRLAQSSPLGQLSLEGAAARDRVLLRWIGALGAVTLEQLRERFSLGRTVAYRRIASCVEGGLVERVRLLHGQPAFLRATSRGLRYAGLALPVARLSPELAGHWLACGWAAIRIERERGIHLISERELRFQERLEGRLLASAVLEEMADGSRRLHRPDFALVEDGRLIAVEIELTPKAPARLEQIVRSWCRARCVDLIRYYASAGATMRGLERAVQRVRGEERVELRSVEGLL